MRFEYAIEISSAGRVGHDRAVVHQVGDELVVVLADGAGTSRAAVLAAEAVVAASARGDLDWDVVDEDLARLGGRCTAVVVTISQAEIRGVSIGDSAAWLFGAGWNVELTEHQVRRPLLGDGGIPVVFESGPLGGATLVVASDGLWNYAKLDAIAAIARGPNLVTTATSSLIELVRLPTGGLADDVAVVIVR